MPFTVTMPKLSPTMESGTVAKWHKKVGDQVNAGDVLLEVSTDKATVEHTALDEGWLKKILVNEGEDAAVNQPIAIFTESKDESIEGYTPEGIANEPAEALKAQEAKAVPEAKAAPLQIPKPAFEQPKFTAAPKPPSEAETEKRIFASPLARKLAKERGIDLSNIKGTGPGKRIVSRDLEQAPTVQALGSKGTPKEKSGAYVEIPLNQMRKAIARRLQEAKTFIPHFYVEKAIDAEELVRFRDQLIRLGIKVSINDCIVRACALALKEHPGVNSGFNPESQTIVQFKTIDISVAVSVEDGLITPIVRHADYKSLPEISAEIKTLAKKAKEGKLAPHEFQGGSFTISNLGMYDVKNFQAIINPPQSAILAVSSIMDVPVVKGGIIVPGKMMHVTLSSDHRVVDGVKSAMFLKTLQKYLENPASLLL